MANPIPLLVILCLSILHVLQNGNAKNTQVATYQRSPRVDSLVQYKPTGKTRNRIDCTSRCERITGHCVSVGITSDDECLGLGVGLDEDTCLQNSTEGQLELVPCQGEIPSEGPTTAPEIGQGTKYYRNVDFKIPFVPDKFRWRLEGWPAFSIVGKMDVMPKFGETVNVSPLTDGCCLGTDNSCNITPWPCVKSMSKCGHGYCNCADNSVVRKGDCHCTHKEGGVLDCIKL